ncbi:hypothetical protein ACJ2A9_10760 [Anaerobacillus sp. MEB173]|uniref:hypothetical protein n=1 Tax=Anaerobacillus sp. MEB173 TaxID=3383345 RepID=UPI003F8F8848
MSEYSFLFLLLLIIVPLITWKREGPKQAGLTFIGIIGLMLFMVRDQIPVGIAYIGLGVTFIVIIVGAISHFKKNN